MINWDEANVATLKRLWADGLPTRSISLAITGRETERNSVIGKANRLKLEQRQPASGRGDPCYRFSQRAARKPAAKKPTLVRSRIKKAVRPTSIPRRDAPCVPPLNLTLMQLGRGQCRHIAGDDRLYCGQPTWGVTAWCEHHYGLVYQPHDNRRQRYRERVMEGVAG
jgi:hypothetical protein